MTTQLEGVRRFVAERPPTHDKPVGGGAHVLVVGSGKGGVGTSTVSALLALVAAADGRNVLLVDAAGGLGSQPLLLGVGPRRGLGALRDGAVPRDLVVPVANSLSLLPISSGEEDAGLSAAERRALFSRAASLFGAYELVVVDGGSRLESVLGAMAPATARLVAVATADRIAIAATYALVKAVGQRFVAAPVHVLVNRQDEAAARAVFEEMHLAARRFLERSVGYAGHLPEDACLAAGVAGGMTVPEVAVGSPAAAAMRVVSASLFAAPRARRG